MWLSQCGEPCTLPPSSQSSTCLTVISTRRVVSMCHRLVGANLGDIWLFSPGADGPWIPTSLPPGHPSPHLSAASRMPEAQSACRSGGQDSRKPCSSCVMARTLELFTRARLSSRARLAGEMCVYTR